MKEKLYGSIKKYFQNFESKYLSYAIICFAIIVLIRPSNAIVIFAIPFLAGDLNSLKKSLKLS
jgi:hypothetical protein